MSKSQKENRMNPCDLDREVKTGEPGHNKQKTLNLNVNGSS